MAACPETKLYLPQNRGSSCWWLALNFALFHLERPELEDFLKAKDEDIQKKLGYKSGKDDAKIAAVPNVIKILKETIRYYKGEGEQIEAGATKIDEYRSNKDMATIFNNDTIDSNTGKAIFKMDGGGDQDATEWFNLLNPFFEIGFLDLPLNSAGLIDITIGSSFFPRFKVDDDNFVSEIIRLKDSKTLILGVNRTQTVEKPAGSGRIISDKTNPVRTIVPIQRFLMLPIVPNGQYIETVDYDAHLTKVDTNLNLFELDAIVEGKPGHYNALIKCTGTDSWILYGSMAKGNPTVTYSSFEDMKAKYDTLEKLDRILIYHYVKTVEKQTLTPPGIKASVLEESIATLKTKIGELEEKEIEVDSAKITPKKEEQIAKVDSIQTALRTNPNDISQVIELRSLFSTISGYKTLQRS
jgi:hypothetical protein